MQAHEGIEQLKQNLKREHDLKVDWMTSVLANVRAKFTYWPMHFFTAAGVLSAALWAKSWKRMA